MDKKLRDECEYDGGYDNGWFGINIPDKTDKTSDEKLDEIPLADIEKYLRRKKLENIKK